MGKSAGWGAGAILVTAGFHFQRAGVVSAAAVLVVARELLPDADRLEVHTEDSGDTSSGLAIVGQAVDLVEDSFDFLLIVLDRADDACGGIEAAGVCVFRRDHVFHAFA